MLRVELARSRQDGLTFEAAWTLAVNRVTREQDWTHAFDWSKEAWRRGYERQRPAHGERVKVAAGDLTPAA